MTDQNRFHSMDAFRALLMLCVIIAHAAMAYSSIPFLDLAWPVHDKVQLYGFDLILWAIQGFAMPGFFLVAGFWSKKYLESHNLTDYLRQRASKLVVPFLLACLLILPLCYTTSATGWFIEGKATLREVLQADFENPLIKRNLIGPGHLWFLEALAVISFLSAPILMWLSRPKAWNVVFLMGVTAALLYFHPEAILNLHNSFIPQFWRTLHYEVFFLGGAVLYGMRGKIGQLFQKWIFWIVISLVAFPLMAGAAGSYMKGGAFSALSRLSLAAGGALYCWMSVLGVLGFFNRYFEKENNRIRALSDASYWVYLVHLPVVFMAQIALLPQSLPVLLKFAMVCGVALALGLLSFRLYAGAPRVFSLTTKWAMSGLFLILIAGTGIGYQYLYRKDVEQCRLAVTRFYLEYFHRTPDAIGLHYWTMRAATGWGLSHVERVGFRLAKESGAR